MKERIFLMIEKYMAEVMSAILKHNMNAKELILTALELERGKISLEPCKEGDSTNEMKRYVYFPASILTVNGTIKVTDVFVDNTGDIYVNGFDRKHEHLFGIPLDESQYSRILNFIHSVISKRK